MRAPRRPAAQVGRALHHPSGGHRRDLRGAQARQRHPGRRAAARRGRGHRGPSRRCASSSATRSPSWSTGSPSCPADLPVARGGAGREHPQDDHRHGQGHPRDPHQAGRPPAQHAHARRTWAKRSSSRRPRRRWRSTRPSPTGWVSNRCVGARGPRLRDAASPQVRRDPGMVAQRRADRERDMEEAGPSSTRSSARQHRGRDLRPRQALLLHLRQDGAQGQGVQRDLRPHRAAGARGLGEGLLRRPRRHPLAVEAPSRALQGLHRHAQVQHVPVAAHHGHRAAGQAARDPDPHPRHARDRPVRHRRPLDVQGQAAPSAQRADAQDEKLQWLRSDHGLAVGDQGPGEFMESLQSTSSTTRSTCSRPRARSSACRPAPPRWTSPTPSTPTSATAASGPRWTAASCRSPTSSSPATSSRSSPRRRARARRATGCSSSPVPGAQQDPAVVQAERREDAEHLGREALEAFRKQGLPAQRLMAPTCWPT